MEMIRLGVLQCTNLTIGLHVVMDSSVTHALTTHFGNISTPFLLSALKHCQC